MMSLEMAK